MDPIASLMLLAAMLWVLGASAVGFLTGWRLCSALATAGLLIGVPWQWAFIVAGMAGFVSFPWRERHPFAFREAC